MNTQNEGQKKADARFCTVFIAPFCQDFSRLLRPSRLRLPGKRLFLKFPGHAASANASKVHVRVWRGIVKVFSGRFPGLIRRFCPQIGRMPHTLHCRSVKSYQVSRLCLKRKTAATVGPGIAPTSTGVPFGLPIIRLSVYATMLVSGPTSRAVHQSAPAGSPGWGGGPLATVPIPHRRSRGPPAVRQGRGPLATSRAVHRSGPPLIQAR